MATSIRQLSWTPRRRGNIYCAPACGAGCTVQDYERAKRLAKKIAARLGPGWKPRVHENMGWYASVIDKSGCWYISIHRYGKSVTYTAFLGEPFSYAGKWAESADTPEGAIEKVREVARDALADMQRIILMAQQGKGSLYGKR